MRQMSDKIKDREEIAKISEALRHKGKKIAFTSGSFDLLHGGHADYLEKAKKTADLLIVGVNSDNSVKQYKGQDRPIIPEKYRLMLIAALECVDYCFLFDERRNAVNIEMIKPNYYVKAGDYLKENLTSADLVEKYGGEVVLIPMVHDISSTNIIRKIRDSEKTENSDSSITAYIDKKPIKKLPAIFLDRDGVINEEIEYLHEPEKFKMLPNVIEGIKRLQNRGFKIVVVTNQAGIGLGYFTKEDFYKTNKKMLQIMGENSIIISKVYFCPHSIEDNCDCRKPKPGMILRAEKDMNIDLNNSWMIGDKADDILAGNAAGVKTILVGTGHGSQELKRCKPTIFAKDLFDVYEKILIAERKKKGV